MQPSSEAAGRQSGPPRSALVYIYIPIPFIIFALLSLLPSRNSDPGAHSRLFSSPHYGSWLAFYREKMSALSSLVDSRRTVCLPTLGALSNWSFFIFANKFRNSPRRDSNSRPNTSSIRGLPLDHRGDQLIKRNFETRHVSDTWKCGTFSFIFTHPPED